TRRVDNGGGPMGILRVAAVVVGAGVWCRVEASKASADEWVVSEPARFPARGLALVAGGFSPPSRHDSRSHALCYFYEVGYPGIRWDLTPRLKWKRELANDRMPVEAIVSMDGWLVTFNDWGGMGMAHSIVLYDPRGRLVADWSGDQLFAHPAL